MKTFLSTGERKKIQKSLTACNRKTSALYPGSLGSRQPVHTLYGGAHLFQATTCKKLGELAVQAFREYAPNFTVFAKALELKGVPEFHEHVFNRVQRKLATEPVEDFRIDFEDGFGPRPDQEEDDAAMHCGEEYARACSIGSLPFRSGIRIKALSEESRERSLRTLEFFFATLSRRLKKSQIPNFVVVTLPKITNTTQIEVLARVLALIEKRGGYKKDSLKMELMVETPQSIYSTNGGTSLLEWVRASDGRCVGAHFGAYDYTASLEISGGNQRLDHPSCDFARHTMQVVLAGSGIEISDGVTNIMPIAIHRGRNGGQLSELEKVENRASIHHAWKLNFQHIRRSLQHGFYQGWDLHPSQLPVRFAALHSFFLEELGAVTTRLKNFLEVAARATVVGAVFDDAATAQGLLNTLKRGFFCGAITEEEVQLAGLSKEELSFNSFQAILELRRKKRKK